MTKEQELSLGQRVHLASKDLRKLLNPSIAAALVGLALIGFVALENFHATSTLDQYGYHEYRLNSPDGPKCNTNDEMVSSDSDPARVVVINGSGAAKAGIQNGDVIVSVNSIAMNAGQLPYWHNLVPSVKPGDVVQVIVLRNGQQSHFSVQTTVSPTNSTIPVLD